jgi:hypothetical protein
LTLPFVAVIDALPAKFGDEIVPLPESIAELVVIVYAPAGSDVPLSISPSVEIASVKLPAAIAVKLSKLALASNLL